MATGSHLNGYERGCPRGWTCRKGGSGDMRRWTIVMERENKTREACKEDCLSVPASNLYNLSCIKYVFLAEKPTFNILTASNSIYGDKFACKPRLKLYNNRLIKCLHYEILNWALR